MKLSVGVVLLFSLIAALAIPSATARSEENEQTLRRNAGAGGDERAASEKSLGKVVAAARGLAKEKNNKAKKQQAKQANKQAAKQNKENKTNEKVENKQQPFDGAAAVLAGGAAAGDVAAQKQGNNLLPNFSAVNKKRPSTTSFDDPPDECICEKSSECESGCCHYGYFTARTSAGLRKYVAACFDIAGLAPAARTGCRPL